MKAILAICAHWLDADYKQKSALLALKEVHGNHSGEMLGSLVHEVIKEFEFQDNVGYFVMDNEDSNDKALEVLCK